MNLRDEEILAGVLLFASMFAIINISPDVGIFYTFAVMIYFFSILTKRKDYIIEFIVKNQNYLKSLIVSLFVFGVWLVLSSLIIPFFDPQTESMLPGTIVFERLAEQTQIPVLSEDPTVRFVVFGVMIPILETFLFLGFGIKLAAKALGLKRIKWYKLNTPQGQKMLWICAIIGVIASLFHMSVRLAKDYALIVDVMFFFISALLVFYTSTFKTKRPRLFEGGLFHIFTNSGVLLLG